MKILNLIKKSIFEYEVKKGYRKVFDCTGTKRLESRREEYSIPADKPQCPVFNDNRCCGGCFIGNTCEYTVDCNCYGMSYGTLGGLPENYHMHDKERAKYGGLRADGSFDWHLYYYNKFKSKSPDAYVGLKAYILTRDDAYYENTIKEKEKYDFFKDAVAKLKKEYEEYKKIGFNSKVLLKTDANLENISESSYVEYVEVISYDAENSMYEIDTTKTGGNYKGNVPADYLDFYKMIDI